MKRISSTRWKLKSITALNPVVFPSQTISIDKVDGDWSKYINLKIDDNDRSFSLASDESRKITVEIEVGEASLIQLTFRYPDC